MDLRMRRACPSPWFLPRKHTQHQVEHEEGADDDERNEVQPVPCVTSRIVGLEKKEVRQVGKHLWSYQCAGPWDGHNNVLAPGRPPQKGPVRGPWFLRIP